MNEQLPGSFGDQTKRTCEFYGSCDNWVDLWEDETGTQMQCPVCGAAVFAENDPD